MTETRDARRVLAPDAQGLERGVRLFTGLVKLTNRGEAVGISYSGLIAYLHDAHEFREVAGRHYLPSDSGIVVQIALDITMAAGGRKEISRQGRSIRAGMDTFVWTSKSPFDRPARAWLSSRFSIPYTREQWLCERYVNHSGRRAFAKVLGAIPGRNQWPECGAPMSGRSVGGGRFLTC